MLIFDGSVINISIAFLSGVITFFASCFLPLVPVYIAYISGISLNTKTKVSKNHRKIILTSSLLFVLGFVSVFVLLGATLSTFARTLSPYRDTIEKLAGILFILLGLQISGLFKLSSLSKDFHIRLDSSMKKYRKLHALLTGMAFGFGWSPCIGPVLGVILLWASRQATFSAGLFMLIFYGLGIGVPFIFIALGFERILPILKKSKKYIRAIELIAGLLIILAGILLLINRLDEFSIKLIYFVGLDALSV